MLGLVIGILVFIGLMLIILGLASSGRGSGINARLERYTAGKAEAQPCRLLGETPHEDAFLPEMLEQRLCLSRPHQPEQRRAADDLKSGLGE